MIAVKEAFRAGLFTRKNFIQNTLAGLIVGIVALPLSMAFAIASGARPENGIYTAIVAGLLVGVFGGTRTQIAGPTGAFIVILADITGQYGFAGLQFATFIAGGILIIMGLMRLGNVIKFIPEPVIAGFTSGIGVIIFVGEWKDFFGLPVHLGLDAKFHTKLITLVSGLPHLSIITTVLALLSLGLVIYNHKIKYLKVLPGPLVAMLAATIIQMIFGFKDVATLGSVFGTIPRGIPEFSMPHLTFGGAVALLGPAFTIALLGAIESLLSATAADGLANTKHRPNQELIGQGIANCISPLFGGFAATGAIARTATNIRNGGNSPISAIIHSLFLLVIIVLLAPLAEYIPLCSLAAILFVVAYNMSDFPHFGFILKHSPRDDKLVLLATFFLTVFADLVIAVNIGVVLAMLFFMRRMTLTTHIQEESPNFSGGEMNDESYRFRRKVTIFAINGPMFFAVTEKFAESLSNTHSSTVAVIFKFHAVPFIDYSGLSSFQETIEKLYKRNIMIYLVGVNERIEDKFKSVGLLELVVEKRVFDNVAEIVDYDNRQPLEGRQT